MLSAKLATKEVGKVARKKRQVKQGITRVRLIIACIIIVLAFFVLLATIPCEERGSAGTNAALYSHQAGMPFWIMSGEETRDQKRIADLVLFTTHFSHLAEEALDAAREISPLGAEIADNYKSLNVGIYDHGRRTIRSIVSGQNESSVSICFMPADARDLTETNMAYDNRNKAILCRAIAYPPIVFKAAFLHEAGHALYLKKGYVSATAPPSSDAYIEEEVVMHEFDGQATDLFTGGRYFQKIDQIVAANYSADFRKVVDGVRKSDHLELDDIDGCSGQMRGAILHAYPVRTYAIAFRSIDKMAKKKGYSEKQKMFEKVRAFRYLDNYLNQPEVSGTEKGGEQDGGKR